LIPVKYATHLNGQAGFTRLNKIFFDHFSPGATVPARALRGRRVVVQGGLRRGRRGRKRSNPIAFGENYKYINNQANPQN
jgi:hypothetical protein